MTFATLYKLEFFFSSRSSYVLCRPPVLGGHWTLLLDFLAFGVSDFLPAITRIILVRVVLVLGFTDSCHGQFEMALFLYKRPARLLCLACLTNMFTQQCPPTPGSNLFCRRISSLGYYTRDEMRRYYDLME
jgi:hypothetical protein